MDDIKNNFEIWLKEKEYKQTATSGKHSTISNYISKINKVCKYLNTNWYSLAKNIDATLFYYTLCENNTYYFHHATYDEGSKFLNDIYDFYQYTTYNSNITYPSLNLNWSYQNEKYYATNNDELEYLINNYNKFFVNVGSFIGPLFILNQTSDIKNKQTFLQPLKEFHEFILTENNKHETINRTNEYFNCEELKINIFKLEYRSSILKFILDDHSIEKVLELLNNASALNINIDVLIIDDVIYITNSSRRTVKKLHDEGKLCYAKKSSLNKNASGIHHYTYTSQELINYLKKSFHQRTIGKNFLDYKLSDFSKFYKSEEVAKKTNYSKRHIGRLREDNKFNYFNIHNASYRYCPIDVEIIKNEHN